ncbi:MAG: transcription termination factor NusA [Bacteroidetes bacterium]|jgi:N utilization substance protein A|nr:transcription termination factor NusA [Bacteroidota bacterium]
MAKNTKTPVVDQRSDLVESLGEFSRFKNIDRATLMSVLEEVIRAMIRRKYGTDENFNLIVNVDKGDIQVFRERLIVEDTDIEDENTQITLSEALAIDEDYEVGDEVAEVVSLAEFGLRTILSAKQLLAQKIKELEKSLITSHYQELIGEIVVGEVYQIWRNEILVIHEDNELILPKAEQIPKDRYKKGDTIRAVILDVVSRNGTPRVIISRASPTFLERLFEMEVPEIYDGLINIKGIVRDPGERAKVAVESYDERIDPVGACVGMRGSRIHGIVRELRNENIDVINFSNNAQLYITRALSPAKISNIVLDDSIKQASVYLKADQVSLAIGKGGQNVKLASKLTGYELDIFREADPAEEEDVELDEFSDEIDPWILDALKAIGCDSARDVLRLENEVLERRTDLEAEVIVELKRILQQEFED